MNADFTVTVQLPIADVEAEVGALSLRQVMLAKHRATTSSAPEGFTVEDWEVVHFLALRVRRLGAREGITADELIDLADADTSALMDAVGEVQKREARFRVRPAPPAVVDGAGGTGDGLEP